MRFPSLLLVALIAGLAAFASPAQATTITADATGSCAAVRFVAPAMPRAADEAIPVEDDADCDEVANEVDNCPTTKNGDQSDIDRDGFGDRCDSNADNDNFENAADNCPYVPNDDQNPGACLVDTDRDGVMDPQDTCPRAVNPEQTDTDRDTYGDACDGDDDDDYHLDGGDNCPLVANPGLADADRDGLGDACDPSTSILTPTAPPATAPGTTTGPGSVGDLRAPTVAVRMARVQRRTDAAGGMPVLVRCSEACAVTAKVTVSARDARKLKLARSARRPVVVATGDASVDAAGSTYVFFKLTSAARRRVFTSKPVAARLEIAAVDAASNRTATKRALQFRR